MFVRTKRKKATWLVLAAVLLAGLLPLPLLKQSLWIDEASSVWFARLPMADLLFHLCDPHPPGYYLLLKGWLALGETEAWLRLLSVLASVAAVALTAQAGRAILSARVGALAALLVATFPLQSWYAAEVRMYAVAQALGVALLLLAWRFLSVPAEDGHDARQAHTRIAASFWLVAVVALAVDVSALLPYAAIQLWWLARGRPHAGRWLRLQAAVLIPITIAWLFERVATDTYHAVFVAVQARRLGVPLDPGSAALLLQVLAVTVGLVAVAVAWGWRGRLSRFAAQPAATYLLLATWLLLLAFCAVPRFFSVKRLLVVILPYLALFLAHRLVQHRPRAGWVTVSLNTAVTLWMLASFQREPWREIVAAFAETNVTRPTVAWVDDHAVPVFDYYIRRVPRQQADIMWTPLLGADLPTLPELKPPLDSDLWLVLAESPYRDLSAFLPAEFHQQYQLSSEQHGPGIGLWRYRRLPEPLSAPPHPPEPSPEAYWGLTLPSPLATCR